MLTLFEWRMILLSSFKFSACIKFIIEKKASIGPGINLAVTNSMGCLDLQT